MEVAQWGVGVDQEDGVVGGGVGHVDVVVERFFDRHKIALQIIKKCHLSAAKQMGGSCMRVRRPEKRQTGRPEGLPHTAAI